MPLTLLSSALTLLLAAALSMLQLPNSTVAGTASAAPANLPSTSAAEKQETTRAGKVKLIVPAKDLVPGVILRPEVEKKRPVRFAAMTPFPGPGLSLSKPLDIPFTGEYHLFPTASGRVQRDSAVYSGTPIDAVYVNVSGGTLETHAVQELRPALDFASCGAVEVTLVNGDRSLGSATVELVLPNETIDLKHEIFGFERGPDEILSFPVPAEVRGPVRTVRVKFRLVDPSRRNQTAKVAVRAFRFIPR